VCNSNLCGPGPVDAGGGTDSGSSQDSGTPGGDSGAPHDGGINPPSDSGTPPGNGDASSDAGAAQHTNTDSGCSCKVAEPRHEGTSPALLGFGALALIGGLRLRRRR
jgi:MYXO-CTERM domain-containing protein